MAMLHCVKSSGFVLIIVLVFMQVFALLSWCAIEGVLLEMKMLQQHQVSSQVMSNAEQILKKVEDSLLHYQSSCLIPQIESAQLLSRSLHWWQSSVTCAGIFRLFQYYYVVEFLGNDPCATVTSAALTTVNYWRITILVKPFVGSEKVWLQSTIATASDIRADCHGVFHDINIGRQSWCELK